ncbi:MAG: carboxyl transferase domain-containing protein, partial [Pseudomonadota bacterium]
MSDQDSRLPKRVLIANRGEIAVRLMRTAADLGVETVAVFSEDDATALHVSVADYSVALKGRGAPAYLDAEQVVSAATANGCDAIHPGYGFLSENSDFASLCVNRGVNFIGPNPDLLDLFGDKVQARLVAAELGVPILEGTQGPTSLEDAKQFFDSLGEDAAVMIKAVAGGGGRGMRAVENIDELADAYERCSSEADKAFGCADVYLERLIRRARHVEVQIVGDGSGAVSHLWERECTLQRRHQKLVEIAPSPWISETVRARILDAAISMAKSTKYKSLGTFEFLVDLDRKDEVVFIEANPRLQVEHTVTEEVTGYDLVEIQLRLAAGATLSDLGLAQGAIAPPNGYSVQVRVNMETMSEDGQPRPASGTIDGLNLPSGPGIRVDTFAYTGFRTSPSFDSLLAKLICRSPADDIGATLRKTQRALEELSVGGVPTNAAFLKRLLAREETQSGEISTRFIEDKMGELFDASDAQVVSMASAVTETSAPIKVEDALPAGQEAVPAAMPAVIVSIDVEVGASVERGQRLCVLESMKMEHDVFSPWTGTVQAIPVEAGLSIEEGERLIVIEPDDSDDSLDIVEHRIDSSDANAWQTDLEELERRLELVHAMGGEEGIARQRKRGKLTVRERIDLFADPGSFREIMRLGGEARYENGELVEFTPKNAVGGTCEVNGRKVFVQANDFSVRGGSGGNRGGLGQETGTAQRALEWKIPYVRLIDGAGGSVASFEEIGRTYLPDTDSFIIPEVKLLNVVPVVSTTLGVAAGLPAIHVCMSHFSVMVKDIAQVFPGGPPVVKAAHGIDITKEELGGWELHTQVSGVVDNIAETEADAIEQTRRFLSYLPANVWELPPRLEPTDPIDRPMDELLTLVPHNPRRPFDPRKLLELIVDQGSFFEIAPDYGRARVTGLARVGGIPCGIMSNNPYYGSATGLGEGEKTMRLIRLCDTFHLPLVSFVDEPGFQVGPEVEKMGIERAGARFVIVVSESRMPWISF